MARRADLARDAARGILCHLLVAGGACLLITPLGIGSTLTVVMVGSTLSALVGGLWIGSAVERSLHAWRACAGTMPRAPWAALARGVSRPAALAAGLWALSLLAAIVGSLWSRETPAQVALAHTVIIGLVVAGAGVGVWIESAIRAPRLTVVCGAVAWLVPLSAFLWAPGIVEPGRAVLERAVRVSPVAGVLAALGKRNIFWTPALYGTLPYADYGVQLGSATAQAAAWTCVGVGLLAGRCVLARAAWRRA